MCIRDRFNGNFLGESAIDSEEHGKIVFYAVNTDAQALRKSQVQQTVQIGGATTKGLGAGANPNVGRKAAEDDQEEIRKMLEGADMVFIAAGMGGGTGTGAAPIVAKVAKELGILTVAVVTKPFSFEGKKRMQFAELGIKDLSQYVDSMIIIPNQQIQKVLPKNATLIDAFAAANDVLRNSVMGISDMITSPGLINVDFADVRTVMSEMGQAMTVSYTHLRAVLQARKIIQEYKPNAVLGMGGYVSGPGGIAAKLCGVPVILHEQNAVAGLTNEWLAKIATRVLQAFPTAFKDAEVVGNPVRQDLFEMPLPQARFSERTGKLRVLVVGGSQGARVLNQTIPQVVARLANKLEVRHQVGKGSVESVTALYI